jgi:hypothetical protein
MPEVMAKMAEFEMAHNSIAAKNTAIMAQPIDTLLQGK